MSSPDLTMANIEKIAELFPNVMTEAKDEQGNLVQRIDFEKLKQELSADVIEGDESYDFTWVGKKQAMVEANKPTNKTLRPCLEESVNWDKTENLYIEGDNLEVLKLLQESYLNKIKMIYIDPPYNTGNDSFIYPDDYATNKDQYDDEVGAIDESGYRMFKNVETNGRFHSSWCSMMYSRLKVARNLLSDDGVIFISIDDNEVENLKKICDEIFGESNFIVVFPRITKKGGKSSEATAKNHDYVLLYSKNRENVLLKGIEHTDAGYSIKDEYFDERGYYKLNQTLDYDSLGYVKSLDYPIEINGEVFYAGGDKEIYEKRQSGMHRRADWGWRWRWSKDLFAYGLKNGFIEIKRGGTRPRIYTKTYQNVKIESINGHYEIVKIDRTKPLSTLEFVENEYSNDNATKCITEIMGKGIFEYTKHPVLIKKMMTLLQSKSSLILDFFSGSATTAHAVMQLNSEDGGNRKFIMVQLPEVCDEKSEAYKAGYKNICEIGKERIRRAGKKIVEESGKTDLDIGFRVLKLDDSNMKDVYYTPDELTQSDLVEALNNIKDGRSGYDLLYQCMLDWGLELSLPHETIKINNNEVHIVNDGDLIACFDDKISEETIKQIAEKKPLRAVFRDSSFATPAARINVDEIFKLKSPHTTIKVL